MNERYIYLQEKFLESEITSEELKELESILSNNTALKEEFEEQKRIKEALKKMKLKNPSRDFWDAYWTGIYNRIERGFAWVAVSIGVIILAAFGIYNAVESFLADTQTPPLVKFGITALAVGLLILLVSVMREKLFTYRKDKYKEIQR